MTTKRVVSYLRISTANQIDNTSIETQREKIDLYCRLNNFQVVEEFKDEAISGKYEHNRKDYKRMMQFILNSDNKIDAIVVYKSDRIHRSLKNLMLMLDDLQEEKINFISITEQFDTSTAQGMLFLQMLGSFAEFERKIIAERTKGGRISNGKNELYAGGRPPFGYCVENKELIKVEEEAIIVKNIFKLRCKGKSLKEIGDIVGMSKQRVHSIIRNKVYMGVYEYNGKVEHNNITFKVQHIVTTYTFQKANLIGRYL